MAAEHQTGKARPAECGHVVQFYDADDHLVASVGAFLGGPIGGGGSGVVIATAEHQAQIASRLGELGLDVERLRAAGRYVALDAREVLERIRVDGQVDSARFAEVVGGAVARAGTGSAPVHIFGEVVALLWAEGLKEEAARLEAMWNDLGRMLPFTLLCGYPTALLRGRELEQEFGRICALHTGVMSTGGDPALESPAVRWVSGLQRRAQGQDADTLDQARGERDVRLSEVRYRRLFETARDGILLISPGAGVIEANPYARRLLGRTLEHIVGRTPAELGLFPSDAEFQAAVDRLRTGEQLEYEHLEVPTPSGTRQLEMMASIYEEGGHEHVQCHLRDVTARREAEQASARLAAIVASSDDAIISKTLDGTITSWNEAAQRILGYSREEIVGRSVITLIPEDLRQEETHILARIGAGQTVQTFETQRLTKDGRRIDVSLTISPIRDARGRIIGASKILRDITASRRAAEALHESQRLLNVAMQAGGMGTWAWDLRGGAVLWSSTLEALHGLPAGAFHGTLEDAMRQVHPDDRERVRNAAEQAVGDGGDYAAEYRIVLPDGAVRWMAARGRVVRDEQGAALRMTGVSADITERRLMEENLRQSRERLERAVRERTRQLEETHQRLRVTERMAALGTLSTGIGHDMGNLLLPIHVRVQSLETREVPEDLREDLCSIRTCVEYLQRLAKGLRLLALDPELSGEPDDPVDLAAWWSDVLPMMQTGVPRGVTLDGRFAPGLPALAVPRHQLTQAVFNLVQNAGGATRDVKGGRIGVEGTHGLEGTVLLRIADNGVGMTPEVKARCMEPFFTTRGRSLSTGLGLSLVTGVVERSRGSISVDSAPGAGTTFTLTLPAAAPRPVSSGPRGLVDLRVQSPRTRSLVASLLKGMGVHPADGAEAALLVTDTPETLNGFLAGDPGRRVVALGGTPGPRTRATAASPRVTELREALRAAVEDCYP